MNEENNNQQSNQEEEKNLVPPETDKEKPSSKNNDKKPAQDDNSDPFSFFKLSIDENDSRPEKNKGPGKPKLPFLSVLILTVLALGFINLFLVQKPDNSIPFSEFRKLVESGEIVSVEMSENSFIGYGPEISIGKVPEDNSLFNFKNEPSSENSVNLSEQMSKSGEGASSQESVSSSEKSDSVSRKLPQLPFGLRKSQSEDRITATGVS